MTDPFALTRDWLDYSIGLAQRNILFLDVLRQRGNQYHEHLEKHAPSVLSFDSEVVLDGATLPRPVNYSLLRIVPPPGVTIDPVKRPFVVVDPRAGHGPGIGGFKPDSEIGVALRAGHSCYFLSFLPQPVPGQTVTDVVRAEAAFLEHVIAAHPQAEGKPVVIGNCQAGWQIMIGAALRPELFGPIIIAGAPLSYWAGWRGFAPMRYLGGLLGGSWMTALAGDLGHGIFDGSWLVSNFENLDPANTFWKKQYNLLAHIDTEPERYLGFERWWNNHVLLNANEMQFIADNLFIGNRLATAELVLEDGERVDLRRIRSPIVVFCSRGDNITPPPQALGWITDLYADVDDIRAHGQTIVYAVHESIGHLGIFVSAKVARKEHEEFASNIDFIDILPPGLYEAEISQWPETEDERYLLRFAARNLDDIRAIVEPSREDDQRFATARRVSEINLELYRRFLQPMVRASVTPGMAEALRDLHPLRLSYGFFSDRNPALLPLSFLGAMAQGMRRAVPAENPFRQAEEQVANAIEKSLDQYREWRDAMQEAIFLNVYGQPWLQAMAGVAFDEAPRRRPAQEHEHREFLRRRIEELKAAIPKGGTREAVLRAIAFVILAEQTTDERSFALLSQLQDEEGGGMSLPVFKQSLRDQFFMLLIDPHEALETLPRLLDGARAAEIQQRFDEVKRVTSAGGPLNARASARLRDIERIFAEAAKAQAEKGNAAAAVPEVGTRATRAAEKMPRRSKPGSGTRKTRAT
ncbi:DUF3141 domain-containing protein [Acetobacteraceae bacterium H6797]|nr:DUF3141 domain-containing protein [Acetobacteraceae bacterium H6797]